MKKYLLIILGVFLITGCSYSKNDFSHSQHNIVVYGDYKCPYCQAYEMKIMPKIKKELLKKNNIKFRFVNMAFLGKDSIRGSRAGHAVENMAPNQYLKFQHLMFSQQKESDKQWITEKLIDQQIDKLDISDEKAKDIKREYRTKNSKSWKDAQKDLKEYKKRSIEKAPTVYVDGKKLDNPSDIDEYKDNIR